MANVSNITKAFMFEVLHCDDAQRRAERRAEYDAWRSSAVSGASEWGARSCRKLPAELIDVLVVFKCLSNCHVKTLK